MDTSQAFALMIAVLDDGNTQVQARKRAGSTTVTTVSFKGGTSDADRLLADLLQEFTAIGILRELVSSLPALVHATGVALGQPLFTVNEVEVAGVLRRMLQGVLEAEVATEVEDDEDGS